ncbi:MAG TPA: hypothetical protein VL137_04125, partial [Polyangiaceae bacterium]|nr:hypothetical protein [Polyangiaceae bacterium]
MTLRKISVLGVAIGLLAGCATEGQDPLIFDNVAPSPVNPTPAVTTPPTQVGQGGSGAVGSVSFGGGAVAAGGGAVGGQLVRVVPTDDRAVTRA